MGCNSDYMYPSKTEVNMSKVAYLIDEVVDGSGLSDKFSSGYHPLVYNRDFNACEMVAKLCSLCKMIDVSQYSLELQIWWRDHQKADVKRLASERGG